MEFLYLLEKLRVDGLNEFMLLVTKLGEETVFLVIALVLFWCVNKYIGYYVLSVGFVGTLWNQFLKLWFRIPRPWVIDPNFTILESAREAAAGYSFPSGHTQSAVGTFGAIAYTAKNRWLKFAAILVAILVAFSRMYIGVHTPLDVFTSVAIALLLIVILKPVVLGKTRLSMPILLGIMLVFALSFLLFVEFYNFPIDIDPHNLASGYKNAYTLLGALSGLIIVYFVDEKWLHFSTEAVWWAQIVKIIGGLAIVLAVKSGLSEPLKFLLGEYAGRAVRYCLIVIVAGILWPFTFRLFPKQRSKKSHSVIERID